MSLQFIGKFLLIVSLSFYLVIPLARGQGGSKYHIDINNGLPSNHIYHAIEDSKGYLWIATEKGVIRYNGYEFKVFNLSDGLPADDIWELMEDKKGRIWLGNISDEYGFIYNNKYHKTFVNGSKYTIYPKGARPYKNGIIFSSGTISGNGLKSVCIEKNDTINFFNLNDSILKSANGLLFFNEKEELIAIRDKSLYNATMNDYNAGIRPVLKFSSDAVGELGAALCISRIIGNYLAFRPRQIPTNSFFSINTLNGETEKISLKKYGINENIRYMHEDIPNKKLYVFTTDFIVVFNYEGGITYRCVYAVKDVTTDKDIDESKLCFFFENDFWGKWVGSTSNGLWGNYDIKNKFIKAGINLTNYRYVGGKQDDVSFWWNSSTATLLCVEKNGLVSTYKLKNTDKVNAMVPYNTDTFLLTNFSNYFFIRSTGKLLNINAGKYGQDILSAIKNDSNDFVTISNRGFYYTTHNKDSFMQHNIDFERYHYLIYDSAGKSYWAYNFNKVFIHGDKDGCYTQDNLLSKFGVKKAEHIVIDNRFGNVFFKGPDIMTVYHPANEKYVPLFTNFNLKGAFIFIYNNTLIVGGRFGLLFSKILGPQMISAPLVYQNVKNINYSNIYDCDVSLGEVMLNTDKGVYRVSIPSDSEISVAKEQLFNYKFTLSYRDTLTSFRSGDTIMIDQNSRRLQFDVINPLGNGQVKYTCRLSGDSDSHELNGNELTIPSSLAPGNYYKLSLKVYDNVWRSDITELYVFIKPYWYQTTAGRRLVWGTTFFLVLLVIAISVLVTRKLVISANQKRNQRREIELKSIYAQLNPHFVFNILNSFVHMIKKDKLNEATTYIAKFSRLLRSYLDSSRDKYVTLTDEIANLENYIQLQKIRFIDAFTYEINIDSNIEHPDTMLLPSFLLQPIVENAIIHGLLPANNGHLRIRFTKGEEPNELICTIEDTGIGREKSKLQKSVNPERKSYGNSLVKELTEVINKYEKMRIVVEYTDKELPQTGTIVRVKIKNYAHGKV